MAQIPSLPIDEPVAEPKASPGQFGSVGETIAGLGQETEQMAQANMAFEGHLIYAQRQLKAAQAEIALDKVKSQVHADLNKARTPEEAQAILDHGRGELQNAIAPYEHDRELSKELSIHLQREDVELQNTVNARKAVIIRDSGTAALEILGKKHVQAAINTIAAGGNSSTENKQFDLQLQGFVQSGILYPQEAEALKMQLSKDIQKGSILTKINSPSQGVRDDVIKQLSSGGGNLEHSELSSGELSQLYTHAVDTNHSLMEKEEAGSLNGALNVKAEAFSSPEFKHPDNTPDYEAREKALQDGDWLKSHGIVTPNGKPNYVMAEKLQEDDARQELRAKKIQTEKDNKISEEAYAKVDNGEMSKSDIDNLAKTQGASAQEIARLQSYLHRSVVEKLQLSASLRAVAASERQVGVEERRQAQEDLKERSKVTSLALMQRIENGEAINVNTEIRDQELAGNLTREHREILTTAYNESSKVEFRNGLGIIGSAALKPNEISDLQHKFTEASHSGSVKPEAMSAFAKQLVDDKIKSKASGYFTTFVNALRQGTLTPVAAPKQSGKSQPTAPKAPTGAVGTMRFSDGKDHWVDKDHKSLGEVK